MYVCMYVCMYTYINRYKSKSEKNLLPVERATASLSSSSSSSSSSSLLILFLFLFLLFVLLLVVLLLLLLLVFVFLLFMFYLVFLLSFFSSLFLSLSGYFSLLLPLAFDSFFSFLYSWSPFPPFPRPFLPSSSLCPPPPHSLRGGWLAAGAKARRFGFVPETLLLTPPPPMLRRRGRDREGNKSWKPPKLRTETHGIWLLGTFSKTRVETLGARKAVPPNIMLSTCDASHLPKKWLHSKCIRSLVCCQLHQSTQMKMAPD